MIRIPMTILATVWLFLAVAEECRATSVATTANALLRECQLSQRIMTDEPKLTRLELLQAGHCMGFVEGFIHTGRVLPVPLRFCTPKEVTLDRAVRVLIEYLNSNPEVAHQDGEILTGIAFQTTWPCR
jgi:hypothetical protein